MCTTSNQVNSTAPVRIALLGASKIANRVVPRIKYSPLLDLHGVAAGEMSRAEEFRHQHGLKKTYRDYDDCLADPSVEAVYISTLNIDHCRLIGRALDAGKHVLCEKPLALTEKDAREIFEHAESKQRIVLEGFMYRFFPQVKKAVEIIQSGDLGDILSVRCSFAWLLYDLSHDIRRTRATDAAGGGALNDLGSYCVDFLNWIFPELEPEDIKGFTQVWDGLDISTTAVLQYSNGKTAVIDAAVNRPGFNAFEVTGTKQAVTIPRFDWKPLDELPVYRIDEDGFPMREIVLAHDAFLPEFEHFAQAVRAQCAPHISPRASIKNARILERIRKSVNRKAL